VLEFRPRLYKNHAVPEIMSADNHISSTLEDYLEAILVLTERTGSARVRDIASELSVHKSTVTAALKNLAEKALVNYAPYECATLTPQGRAIAERVIHDHGVIRQFLEEILLVDGDQAEENACRMEHVMDKDVLDRLVVLAKCMKNCPRSANECFGEYARNVKRELRKMAKKSDKASNAR
jgi:DtxR family Mn-dependent transcriptional regulator